MVKDKPFYGRKAMWGTKCLKVLRGIKLHRRGIARHGYRILKNDQEIGEVTSGTISPMTRESIALGWIETEHSDAGTSLAIEIRGQRVDATITTPPFF